MNAPPGMLVDWKRRYETDGLLKIEGLLPPGELARVLVELEGYVREVVPALSPGDIVFESQPIEDGTRRIRNLWRMEQYSPYFAALAGAPALMSLASTLVHGEAVVSAVELFAKPALVGSVVPYHQDNAYFNLSPPDSFTCWIALDPSTRDNGCVYYGRGTHRRPLWPHKASGVAGNSMMADGAFGDFDEVAGELAPGDAMLHHCLTLHRSEPNRSPHPRRGLLIVYRGAHCRTDPEGARRYNAVREASS